MLRSEDAIRQYKKAIELEPQTFDAHSNLATEYHSIGLL